MPSVMCIRVENRRLTRVERGVDAASASKLGNRRSVRSGFGRFWRLNVRARAVSMHVNGQAGGKSHGCSKSAPVGAWEYLNQL